MNLAKIPLNGQTKFRLNEINKVKDYFNSEIQERETMSKKISKNLLLLIILTRLSLFCLQQVEE